MPTFTMTGLRYVHRWDTMEDYSVTSDTARTLELTHDSSRGRDFDPERSPWKIVFSIQNNTVTRLVYEDRNGDELARITGLDTEADLVRLMLDPDVRQGFNVYNVLLQDGATFEGNRKADWPDANNDISTSQGDDTVRSNGGDVYVKDRGGADLYIGGDGFDALTYDEWFWRDPGRALTGIDGDLAAGTVVGPDGATDTLRGTWEALRGTFLDDTLRGNNVDNELHGFRGDDLIDGRGGFDGVSYRNEVWMGTERGVKVNLQKDFARDSFGDRDRLISIEQAEGTDFNDRFIDDTAEDNRFDGRAGNDVLVMKGGEDNLSGGDGADRFIFRGTAFGNDHIGDFDPTQGDRIRITSAKTIDDLEIFADEEDVYIRLNDGSEVNIENFDLSIDPADYLLF